MKARATLIVLALGLAAVPAAAAGQGLTVVAATPARNGSASIHVEINQASAIAALQPPAAPSFQSLVKKGQSQVKQAVRIVDTGETIYTLLAFDASASFQPHRANALALAHAFADALPAKVVHKTGVLTFGVGTSSLKEVTTVADLHREVDAVRAVPAQPATRLKSSISEAVQTAAKAQPMPTGVRQVIVFTDAGEESRAYSIATIVKEARAAGVRVHIVAFRGASQNSPTFAQYRDELRQLAEGTGGYDVTVQDLASGKQSLGTIAKSSEATWRLELSFCGVPTQSATFDDDLTIELLQGQTVLARSDAYKFEQQAAGAASAPCAAPCGSAGPCGSSQPQALPATTDTPKSSSSLRWVLIALGAGALGGMLLALLLRGRKRKVPAPAPTPLPPPSMPPVPPAQLSVVPAPPLSQLAPTNAAALDPFTVLPETRLVVLQGIPGAPPYYRVGQPIFHIGARADMNLIIDQEMISSHHALFELQPDGQLFLTDQGSTNGTFVEGQRLAPGERRRVLAGQRVALSRFVEFRVEQPSLGGVRVEPGPQGMLQQPPAVGQSAVADGPARKAQTAGEPEGPWKGRP